jgi:ArsR family transcriptional regulator
VFYRQSTMNDETVMDVDLAVALRALSHPARLSILKYLAAHQGQCCCDVAGCLPLAQSTVSQHLKILLEAGLISRHSKGTRNHYALRAERLAVVQGALAGVLGELAPGAAGGEKGPS